MNIIQVLEAEQMSAVSAKRVVPEFGPGDTVKVMVKVFEGANVRTQAYEGVVIARSGSGLHENFTVRKISYGEGVERVFPIYSPYIDDIEVLRRGKVRRAKLYYLRGRRGKAARIVERTDVRARRSTRRSRGSSGRRGSRTTSSRSAASRRSWRSSSRSTMSSGLTRSPVFPTRISRTSMSC